MRSTCRGAIELAEIKPVEPEEARTSVGNKRVYRVMLPLGAFCYAHFLLASPWLNDFPDIF